MLTPGRLLRLLRLAVGLSVDDAAVAADLSALRVRALEAGLTDLGYLEGLVLARSYQLCPNCFAKHFRAATVRGALEDPAATVPPAQEASDA
jgi:hypothetical protein